MPQSGRSGDGSPLPKRCHWGMDVTLRVTEQEQAALQVRSSVAKILAAQDDAWRRLGE